MEQIRNGCQTERDLAIVELLYSTAIRASELTGLNREDINFIGRDIVVFGKGKKEREVYLKCQVFCAFKRIPGE